MKKPTCLLAILAILCALLVAKAEDPLGPEILINGAISKDVSPWRLEVLEHATAALNVVDDAYDGKPAMRVEVGAGADLTKLWAVQLTQENLSFRAGKTYRLTFAAKSVAGKWFFVQLADTKPPYATLSPGAQVQAGDDWKEFSFDFKVTKDCDEGRLVFTNLNMQDTQRFVANISLKEVLPVK